MGPRRQSPRRGYERVRLTFKVEGSASEEELKELVQVAQERSPSVFDAATRRTPVAVERVK
ncbi:MAG: hypothetical protein ACYTDU_06965 [Planctomycetota bacterium]|jgi:uncharacterized OsmC-like protein